MEAKIEKYPPIRVACVRHTGPYEKCEAAWHKLFAHQEVIQACGPDTLMLGLSYDDPEVVPPEEIRYDACITVGEDFQPPEGVNVQEIPGGDFGVMVHKGSYETMLADYKWFYKEWLPGSGRKAKSGPTVEIYRNNPQDTPPEELITEIRLPLEDE